MTVRHAFLPIGGVLVLGLAVYLFVEVRAQPAPPVAERALRQSQPAPPEPAQAPEGPAPHVPVEARAPASALRASRSAKLPPPPAVAASAPAGSPGPGGQAPDRALVGPRLDAVMDEANKAYDRGDLDEAKAVASRVLVSDPGNVRMLRIMVSASCLDGDTAVAQVHYGRLPALDQEQMKARCARYGVTFP